MSARLIIILGKKETLKLILSRRIAHIILILISTLKIVIWIDKNKYHQEMYKRVAVKLVIVESQLFIRVLTV